MHGVAKTNMDVTMSTTSCLLACPLTGLIRDQPRNVLLPVNRAVGGITQHWHRQSHYTQTWTNNYSNNASFKAISENHIIPSRIWP